MRTMILLKGIPASGKSTWAIQYCKDNPTYKRINRDLLRIMLHDYEFNKENEKLVKEIRNDLIINLLLQEYNVILDETNLNEKNYNEICNLAKNIGNVTIKEIYFPITTQEAIERNSKRIGHGKVPDKVIYDFQNCIDKEIKLYDKVLEREIIIPSNRVKQDETLPHAIIVDIDGTLSDSKGIRYVHDLDKVDQDKVILYVKSIVNAYNNTVIILSGREDKCIAKTIHWLQNNEIKYNHLFMRNSGDQRKDFIIKKEIFDNEIKEKYYIDYVLDDREQMCRLYYSMGLNILRVGNPDANF